MAGAAETLAENRTHFEAAIQYADVGAQCIGADCARLPHISSIAFPNLDRQALLMALDLAGVACSSGSACASGSSQPSHVLTAMQLPPEWVQGALRFSFSSMTSRDEIDEAIQRIVPIVGKMRRTHHPSSAIAR